MSQPLIFEIYRDGQKVGVERIDRDAIKIGSHAKSHLHLEDPEVGRVHAVVERSADGVSIIDLGSGRGTFVNGERVNKRTLQHKDTIKLGNTEIVFFAEDESPIARGAAAAAGRAAAPATRDEVVYARRFLARPAATDGAVEIAVLFRDFVVAEELYRPPKDIVLGSDEGADVPVTHPSLGDGDFTLVSANGGQPKLRFRPGMQGEIYIGTERMTLEAVAQSGKATADGDAKAIALTDETRARIVLGDVTIFLHRSTRPVVALPMRRGAMAPLLFMLFSGALHALLLLLILFLPPGLGNLGLDTFGNNDRFVQILIEDAQPEVEEEELADEEDGDDQMEEGDEGQAGDEQAQDEEPTEMAVEGDLDDGAPVELGREEAREAVQERGALAVLNQQGPTSIFGGQANGYDAVMAIGAVSGEGVGASYGTSGLGAYGGGLHGGGRSSAGLRSAGPLALRGRSSGNAGDSELGQNLRNVRDREARPPAVIPGNPEIRGQLDREIIQRVIREHRREIRTCYEQELQRNADLEGRLMVNFLIAPDGQVAASRVVESTLNNDAVETCVATRVQQWRFPEPRGGGSVNVNYPFVFSPGG